jgi:rhomboid family GlyGly-CTERM serine protease
LSNQTSLARFRGSLIWLLGVFSLTLVGFGLFGKAATESFRYERAAVLNGEYWRLVTGHFVHGSLQHLALNLAGLAVIAALFAKDYSIKSWLLIVALSIVVIDAGFVFYEPQLTWYVGFSGVLHGALAAGAVAWWRREPPALALALSGILIGKLAWEQWHGALPLSGDLPVVVDAHLYGAIGGLIAASILWASRQPWLSRPRSL